MGNHRGHVLGTSTTWFSVSYRVLEPFPPSDHRGVGVNSGMDLRVRGLAELIARILGDRAGFPWLTALWGRVLGSRRRVFREGGHCPDGSKMTQPLCAPSFGFHRLSTAVWSLSAHGLI